MNTLVTRLIFWLADRHPGVATEHFADLFGRSMAHSNGVMLERATVSCRAFDHRTKL